MKNPFKIKQGGVLGRNLKRARNIKIAALSLMLVVFTFGAISVATSEPIKVEQAQAQKAVLPGALALLVAAKFLVENKFKELTGEELATFNKEASAEELGVYYKALSDHKNAELQKAIDNKADKSVIDKLISDISKINVDAITKEVVSLQAKVKALEEAPKHSEKGFSTLNEALKVAFAEKAEEISNIVKAGGKQTGSLELTVKVVDTMSVASTIGAGATQVSITQDTNIISTIRKREQTYLAQVSVGSIGTNRAMWIEETDEEGTPIMIGEGDSKTQLDVQYVEQTMPVKKIAVFGKVTTELMADIPQLISYIQNNLMRRMDLKLEDQLFSGNGVGDNLKGLDSYATAFAAGALANTIPYANELDVIEAVALQVKTAFGVPNTMFIHPSTMATIKLIKDTAGRPVWKDYVTIDGSLVVSGMRLIETTAITAGNFIGGDLSVVNVLKRDELGITIGLDGNDFTQNKKTMLLEKRLVQFVSANDTAVIVDGDFTTAKAALLTV